MQTATQIQKYRADAASTRHTRDPRHTDSHPEPGTTTETEKRPTAGPHEGQGMDSDTLALQVRLLFKSIGEAASTGKPSKPRRLQGYDLSCVGITHQDLRTQHTPELASVRAACETACASLQRGAYGGESCSRSKFKDEQ